MRVIVLLLLCASLCAQDRRPNILFIYSDDHAAHAISAYGSRINQTPNIDRLATGGMRFTNSFVTNSICGPARACVLTGKYSHVNGFATNEDVFDGSQPTLPKMMQSAGYSTAIIGKWHLVSDPQGFDHWMILPGQGVYHDPAFIEDGVRKKITGYVTDIITDRTIDWLERGRPKDKPFFLMCQHKAPHRNWEPADRHLKLFEDVDIPEPETFDDDWKNRSSAAGDTTMTVEHHLTKTDVKADPPEGLTGHALKHWYYERYIKDYLRCIAAVDESVGQVLDWLDRSGLAENTIVVYSSDQGFYLGDHGWYDKRWMYEESLRSPLLVRWPAKIAAGSVSDAMVLNIDFAETLLDAVGAPIPGDMQGRSFLPILCGSTPSDWRRTMYYHYYEFPEPHHVQPHFGVRDPRYKLIRYPGIDAWELFDLQEDPHELRSVWGESRYAEVQKKLAVELDRLQAQFGDKAGLIDPALARFGSVTREEIASWPGGRDPHQVLARSAKINVTKIPFSFGARVTLAEAGSDGVIGALGGGNRGFALCLEKGVPTFTLRNGEKVFVVRGRAALPADRESLVVGVLGNDAKLRLFVDGTAVAEAAGEPLEGLPGEGLSLGCDDNSAVGAVTAPFRGRLSDIRLWRGVAERW
ncbi:MAG: sulfatase-like hydrolase/transferase [Planctomycetota bacterium]